MRKWCVLACRYKISTLLEDYENSLQLVVYTADKLMVFNMAK